MKLASYRHEGTHAWGVVLEDGIIPMHAHWPSLADALADGTDSIGARAAGVRERVAPDSVQWLPTVPAPHKIICVGINYGKHAAETGHAPPNYPTLFVRFADSLVGHLQPIVRPRNSERYDYEAELAVVIGKEARHVPAAQALDYVAGYTCFAENCLRDFQYHTGQITPGKNFEHSGAMGPWMVTADEIADPSRLHVISRLNGTQMQHGHVSDLIFSIPRLIEYITSFTRLLPGDIIATGTPEGVGMARKPPVWMRPGDMLEIEIPGIGTLRNTVRDETVG